MLTSEQVNAGVAKTYIAPSIEIVQLTCCRVLCPEARSPLTVRRECPRRRIPLGPRSACNRSTPAQKYYKVNCKPQFNCKAPVNKLVSLTWHLGALEVFEDLHYITADSYAAEAYI